MTLIVPGVLLLVALIHLLPLAGVLIAAGVSVLSFLALAFSVGGYNAALSRVVKADLAAALLLAVAAAVHWSAADGR